MRRSSGYAVGQPQPARGAVALVGEADAAGVDEAHVADGAVVLLVGVAGDDEAGAVDAVEHLAQRSGGEMRVTISSSRRGRRVAEEDAVELERQRQLAEGCVAASAPELARA